MVRSRLPIDPVRALQLSATAVASATAPTTNNPIPNGICPAKSIITPNAKNAPATIITNAANTDFIGCDIAPPQFIAAAATNIVIPATIAAIPKGMNPEHTSTTPSINNAPPTTAARITNTFSISPLSLVQLIANAVTIIAAPITIKAIPKGTLPVTTRITPSTKKNPPNNPKMNVSVRAKGSDIAFQFDTMLSTNPTAPTAIKAIPSGISTPLTTRIVPNTNANALIAASISANAPFNISTIASTLEFTAFFKKSYSGNFMPKSLLLFALSSKSFKASSSLDNILSSSIPNIAFLSFLVAFVALSVLSLYLSTPLVVSFIPLVTSE